MTMKTILAAGLLVLASCTRPHAATTAQVPQLTGTWVAENVAGGGIPDNALVELNFDGGRVSGRSGCNRFTAPWRQDGGSVAVGPVAGTKMLCPVALMDLEGKVLAVLGAAATVTVDATGAATLASPEGKTIKLRRR